MTSQTETRSVVVERDFAFPLERIWRALTQPNLLGEWLMKTDMVPAQGQNFTFSGDWGAVNCQVTAIEPYTSLAYTWAAFGLESVVTWTLTPEGAGTRVRMEQAGFRTDQPQFHAGAQASWPQFIAKLEEVLARME